MTVNEFLSENTKLLTDQGITTARLDCLVLLEDVLNTNRTQILAHPELLLTPTQLRKLEKLISRRMIHEPLAYLRNKTEFYGREFYIDHHVLEPRPESEAMIDLLLRLPLNESSTIVDIGTGSGALAVSAKLQVPHNSVVGIDIDPRCLQVATRNAKKWQVNIHFLLGNLLEPLAPKSFNPTVLLCNLPYVPDSFTINPAAMREPRLAIFGGPDGLDLYRELFLQLQTYPLRPQFVLTESLPPQHIELTSIAAQAHYSLQCTNDFIQLFSSD